MLHLLRSSPFGIGRRLRPGALYAGRAVEGTAPFPSGFYDQQEVQRKAPKMTASETCHYRGYDIVPTRLWSEWCVGIYRTRADLPLMQSSLSTDVLMEEAVDEAKQKIDRTLSLDH